MAATVTTTVQEFTAVVGPQIQAQLGLAAREAVNASAKSVQAEAIGALRRTLGPDQKISGLNTRGRAVKITVRVSWARQTTRPMAVLRPQGKGWHLIERPRKGGYDIKPRHEG